MNVVSIALLRTLKQNTSIEVNGNFKRAFVKFESWLKIKIYFLKSDFFTVRPRGYYFIFFLGRMLEKLNSRKS